MAITYIKITGNTACSKIIHGKDIECRPSEALKACAPQDEFAMVESCKLCGLHF